MSRAFKVWGVFGAFQSKRPPAKEAVVFFDLMSLQQFTGNGQGGNRTPDTRIFSPLLYQLSYLAKSAKSSRHTGLGKGRYPNSPRIDSLLA